MNYKPETLADLAAESGLGFAVIDWSHPRQTWAIFYKEGYDKTLASGTISWNRFVEQELRNKEQ